MCAGVPQPDIVWYKDALPIDPVKTPRYRVLVGGSLQVNGLLPDDTGMFQCFARNQAGEVQTNTYLAVTSESSSSSSQKNVLSFYDNVLQEFIIQSSKQHGDHLDFMKLSENAYLHASFYLFFN